MKKLTEKQAWLGWADFMESVPPKTLTAMQTFFHQYAVRKLWSCYVFTNKTNRQRINFCRRMAKQCGRKK